MGSVQFDLPDVDDNEPVLVRKRHVARIRNLLIEMRLYLRLAKEANVTFNEIKEAYRKKGMGRAELIMAMDTNTDAKFAVADNQMYDRWAARNAAVITAEIAAYNMGIHADDWSKQQ